MFSIWRCAAPSTPTSCLCFPWSGSCCGNGVRGSRLLSLSTRCGASRWRPSGSAWPLESILATALEAKGEFSPAVASYERALSMSGARPPALLNNAAWLLTSELGEHGRAIALASEAVSSSNVPSISRSDRAVFHHTLGAAQLASGDAEAALGTFDRGLALAQTPSLTLGRIEALLAASRRSEATEAFGRLRPGETWTPTQQSRYEALKLVLGAG